MAASGVKTKFPAPRPAAKAPSAPAMKLASVSMEKPALREKQAAGRQEQRA